MHGIFLNINYLRQLDAGTRREYKLHNQPVGVCIITITIDNKDNKLQERKRLRPFFFAPGTFDPLS